MKHDNSLPALIEHWNLEYPQAIAHDCSELAALREYYINQLRYRKLTLIDVVAVLPSGSPFYRHVRNHETAFSDLPEYAHKALFNAYIQNAAYDKLNDQVCEMYAQPWTGIRRSIGFLPTAVIGNQLTSVLAGQAAASYI